MTRTLEWEGHKIEMRIFFTPRLLMLATETTLTVDGRLVARKGGWGITERAAGWFSHKGKGNQVRVAGPRRSARLHQDTVRAPTQRVAGKFRQAPARKTCTRHHSVAHRSRPAGPAGICYLRQKHQMRTNAKLQTLNSKLQEERMRTNSNRQSRLRRKLQIPNPQLVTRNS